jgi:putative DNA primase/helicase
VAYSSPPSPDTIVRLGPLAEGADDILWSYADGVWSPDKHVVRSRAAALLGERYRRTHGTNAEDVVRATSRRITCEPIPEAINFRNGLYLWKSGTLHNHTPDVLSTVQLSVDWDPDATCPKFDRFLSQVVPADMVELVWELIGYLLYSGNPLHKAIMLMGTGRNGKGTLLRVLVALLGGRNTTSVSLHDLVHTRFTTASLFGKIANIAGDIDGTYLESTATFKAITGQDQISAEHKGRDRFDFTPWAVPVFSANKIPASSDVTTGYLSRWLVVPFPNDFTGREDRNLDRRLQATAELQGVAAKAMPALRQLMARGDFDLPESGERARDEFVRRVDQVRTWVDECAELHPDHPFVARTILYTAYKAWTERDGHKPVKATVMVVDGPFATRSSTTGSPLLVPSPHGAARPGHGASSGSKSPIAPRDTHGTDTD